MIAVDTSALIAIASGEPDARACMNAIEAENDVLISAGTVAEALIVARRRGFSRQMATLLDALDFTVIPVSAADARQVADAYDLWGKGVHPAGLNFGDCFAYALAKARGCPLLYLGNDFARTDLTAA